MEIYFTNRMSQTMLFAVGAPIATQGANWTTVPPATIQTQPNQQGQPDKAVANLPVGGTVSVIYKRTNVNQQPQIHLIVRNNGGAMQVTANSTNAGLLNASNRVDPGHQAGGTGDDQVFITFTGQE